MKTKPLLISFITMFMSLTIASCAQNGQTPYIGENGNWWIGDSDTGVHAQGPAGQDGKDTKDELFVISSLNGNVYYPYYPSDNEVRIPEKEFPYTYNIPSYSSAGSFYSFSWLKIIDSKLYHTYLDWKNNYNDKTVTYVPVEEEMSLMTIGNRYFADGTEIFFGNDMLFMSGGFLITKDYAIKNNINIVNLETQQKEWVMQGAGQAIKDQITSLFMTISEENNTVTLPSIIITNEENPKVELSIAYDKVEPKESFILNGYSLQLKSNNTLYCNLYYHLEYESLTLSNLSVQINFGY